MQVGEASPAQPGGLERQGDALIEACMVELCWSMRGWAVGGTTAACDWLSTVTRPGRPRALIGRPRPHGGGSDLTCEVDPGSSVMGGVKAADRKLSKCLRQSLLLVFDTTGSNGARR